MKMLSVGKSDDKFDEASAKAKEMRNVQSENASMTALVLKVGQVSAWTNAALFFMPCLFALLLTVTFCPTSRRR
jgi:hypothetical protein